MKTFPAEEKLAELFWTVLKKKNSIEPSVLEKNLSGWRKLYSNFAAVESTVFLEFSWGKLKPSIRKMELSDAD